MRMHSRSRYACVAFSIVELLVVISIVAVLVAVMLPAIQKSRDVTHSMVCTSGLRQHGIALAAYKSSFKEYLPIGFMAPYKSGETQLPLALEWFRALDPLVAGGLGTWSYTKRGRQMHFLSGSERYVADPGRPSVYTCPASRGKIRMTMSDTSDAYAGTDVDYTYNSSLTGYSSQYAPPQTRFWYEAPKRDVMAPSRAWTLTDGSSGTSGVYASYGSVGVQHEITNGIWPNGRNNEPWLKFLRHPGQTANYLFLDGHAETAWDWPKTNHHAWGNDTSVRNFWWRGKDRRQDVYVPY